MSRFSRLFAVISLVFLLIACGDGLFSSLDDPKEVTLKTVETGTTVQPGAAIPITLEYRSERSEPASTVSAILRAPAGEVVQDREFSAAELSSGDALELLLADIPAGVYFLEIQAWRNGTMLISEERQVFVSSFTPEIRSLAVYPSRLSPLGEAVAVADLRFGEDHRPFMRWSLGGRLVTEGYHDEGFDRAIFAGGEPGVYRIGLEVFPWGPDEGVRVSLGSATRQSGDLVVRDSAGTNVEEGDDSAYLLRYDFAGHLKPVVARLHGGEPAEGEDRAALAARRSGSVVLDVMDSRLGYHIRENGEMIVPVSLFPVHAPGGAELELELVLLSGRGGTIVVIEPAQEYSQLPSVRLVRREEPASYVLYLGSEYGTYVVSGTEREKRVQIGLVRKSDEILVTLKLQGIPVLSLRKGSIPPITLEERSLAAESELLPGRIVLGAGTASPILLTDLGIGRLDPQNLEMPLEQVAQD